MSYLRLRKLLDILILHVPVRVCNPRARPTDQTLKTLDALNENKANKKKNLMSQTPVSSNTVQLDTRACAPQARFSMLRKWDIRGHKIRTALTRNVPQYAAQMEHSWHDNCPRIPVVLPRTTSRGMVVCFTTSSSDTHADIMIPGIRPRISVHRNVNMNMAVGYGIYTSVFKKRRGAGMPDRSKRINNTLTETLVLRPPLLTSPAMPCTHTRNTSTPQPSPHPTHYWLQEAAFKDPQTSPKIKSKEFN
jgi:hypothetical protein